MLTENIMHDCVFKLLQSRDEENLECVCVLLSTIGTKIETEKAKRRMDQYFERMKQIISKNEVTSLCQMMLQDVIDLRDNNWRPSRGERMEEGWSTKAKRNIDRNIDDSKLRIEKNADETIQLGPRRSLSGWGRGIGGRSNLGSENGEKPNAPGYRRLVSVHTTPQSAVTSREGSRNPGVSCEAEKPSQLNKEMSEEEMETETLPIIDEYLHIQDRKEAIQLVQELKSPPNIHMFVYFAFHHVLVRSKEARQQTGHLLHDLINQNVISIHTYLQGMAEILQDADNMETDIPKIWQYLGELIGPMIQDSNVPLSFLNAASESLRALGKADKLMAEVLHDASQRLGHKIVARLWRNNCMDWSFFVHQDKIQQFLKEKNLEFTVDPQSVPSTPISNVYNDWMKENLTELLIEPKSDVEKIFQWIEANIPDEITKESRFIRALMTSVCSSAIVGAGNMSKVDQEVIKKWRALLLKYLDHEQVFEIQALYALQALVHSLEHPPGLLRTFFDTLYDEEIISEDAFNQWETSKDEPEGKDFALKQVVQFFAWLQDKEEDESNM